MSPVKWRPFCLGLNVLNTVSPSVLLWHTNIHLGLSLHFSDNWAEISLFICLAYDNKNCVIRDLPKWLLSWIINIHLHYISQHKLCHLGVLGIAYHWLVCVFDKTIPDGVALSRVVCCQAGIWSPAYCVPLVAIHDINLSLPTLSNWMNVSVKWIISSSGLFQTFVVNIPVTRSTTCCSDFLNSHHCVG